MKIGKNALVAMLCLVCLLFSEMTGCNSENTTAIFSGKSNPKNFENEMEVYAVGGYWV